MKPPIAVVLAVGLAMVVVCAPALHSGEAPVVEAFENAFVKVCEEFAPKVVRVTAEVKSLRRDELHLFDRPDPFQDFSRKFFGEQRERYSYPLGVGSGVIYDPSGLILTNEHVVSGQKTAKVRLESGELLVAEVLGSDSRVDLAVLKIDAKRELPAAKLGRAERVKVGQFVLAFGHPFGVGEDPQPTMTKGHVSATGRTLRPRGDHRALMNLIQTDAAVNPGNSGGPLVNLHGEVIGINVAIFTQSKGSQGIAFAVPMDDRAKSIIKTLSVGKKVERGAIGIQAKDLNPSLAKKLGVKALDGVLVDSVRKGGPADKAGIQRGDVLVGIDGKKPKTTYELRIVIEALTPGRNVDLDVLREGKPLRLKMEVGRRDLRRAARSRYGPRAWRGMEVSQIGDPLIQKYGLKVQRGVVVTRVHPSSPAHGAGLREGMVIEKLNDRPVETAEQFRDMAAGAGRDDALIVTDAGIKLLKAEK